MTKTEQYLAYALMGSPKRVSLGKRVKPVAQRKGLAHVQLLAAAKGKVLRLLPDRGMAVYGVTTFVSVVIVLALGVASQTLTVPEQGMNAVAVEQGGNTGDVVLAQSGNAAAPLLPPPVEEPAVVAPTTTPEPSDPLLPINRPQIQPATRVIDVKDVPYTPPIVAGTPLPTPLPAKGGGNPMPVETTRSRDTVAASGQPGPEPKAVLLDVRPDVLGVSARAPRGDDAPPKQAVPSAAGPSALPGKNDAPVRIGTGDKTVNAAKNKEATSPRQPEATAPKGGMADREVAVARISEVPVATPASVDAKTVTGAATRSERVTVVDIGSDGQFVLITNPRTRLPEKFNIGERIHTGEVIKEIDRSNGVVKLDTRSINLQ
jgi:hypothetical protein